VTIDAGPNWNPKNGPIGAISEEQISQLRAIRDALPLLQKSSGTEAASPAAAATDKSTYEPPGRLQSG